MNSNLLLRPSIHCSPQTLKPSPRFTLPLKPTTLSFRSKTPSLPKALSITNLNSFPQFLQPIQSPNPLIKSITPKHHKTICQATYETVPATDRLISIISYFIPFLGGLPYGYHLFSAFPPLELVFDPLVPIVSFYKSIPLVNFLTFFGLYVGIVRDKKFSRYVRFNALQAVFLEFLLVLPSLLNIVFNYGEGLGYKILQLTHSAVFVVIFACFVYSLGICLFGKTPQFPCVTEAMDSRLTAEDQWG